MAMRNEVGKEPASDLMDLMLAACAAHDPFALCDDKFGPKQDSVGPR